MRKTLYVILTVAIAACSDPMAPRCAQDGPGIPAFDLVAALQTRGVAVFVLGKRLDLTTFSVPAEVLSVNGEEVLVWEYCTGGDDVQARDIGQYGVGIYAVDPPRRRLDRDEHLWTFAQLIVMYAGTDSTLVTSLTDILGTEIVTG